MSHISAECRALSVHLQSLGQEGMGYVPRLVANHVGRWLRDLLSLSQFSSFKFHDRSVHGLVQVGAFFLSYSWPSS